MREACSFLRQALTGHPRADDAVTVAAEMIDSACLHSRSGLPEGRFTVRAEVWGDDHLYVAVRDDGGPWPSSDSQGNPDRGLSLVQALVGAADWGIDGGDDSRLAWARLYWPEMTGLAGAPDSSDRLEKAFTPLSSYTTMLTAELASRGLISQVAICADRSPYLAVHTQSRPLTVCICAPTGWFFWAVATRISACSDVVGAADALSHVLRNKRRSASA